VNETTTHAVRLVDVASADQIAELFGKFDENLRLIESLAGVEIAMRDHQLSIMGPPERMEAVASAIQKLLVLIARGESLDRSRIRYALDLALEGKAESIDLLASDTIAITHKGKPLRCKTLGQKQYVQAIKENTVTFAIGPAGTGKTYLGIAMAVTALKNKEVERIILTRPAVEAGEKLGFLPGDLQTKIDPYLRPLYDALFDMIGAEAYARMMERGVIEVAPLAYMRGRTLSDAFIILDEAQNTSCEQMKMFLTRFGAGAKVVVTGDITQMDLPSGKRSGLVDAMDVLKHIKDIGMVQLTHRDVVRHELVQAIVKAYDRHSKKGIRAHNE